MFAYCGNNPVNRSDPTGEWWWLLVVGLVGGLLTGCSQQDEAALTPEEEAAFEAGVMVRELTNADNCEYVCGVYKTNTGDYLVGNCYRGSHSSVNPSPVFNEAMNYPDRTLVALVHSHPYCNGHVPNKFSMGRVDEHGNVFVDGDLKVSVDTGLPVYLATPSGSLLYLRATNIVLVQGVELQQYDTKFVASGLPKDETIFYCW